MINQAVSKFLRERGATFAGDLVWPDSDQYETLRHVHNGMIDKRPAVIARARTIEDIVNVVEAAVATHADLAIRGGGHSVAGFGSVEGGILLDLSFMKAIHVDVAKRTARVDGGALWNEFNHHTQMHGLATTGGIVASTGVAGLTLGGGLGWLMGKYGLALDNLLSARIVTAAGDVLEVNERECVDLFWAIRGAGANFGVVSSFEFALHPVGPSITGGMVAHHLDDAREVLRFYGDLTVSLPDEATVAAVCTRAPNDQNVPLIALVMCHCGSSADADRFAAKMKAFGHPLVDTIGRVPYSALNQMLDAGFPRGMRSYWKSRFLRVIGDDTIDILLDQFLRCPSPPSFIVLEHIHGAAARVSSTATAFPHRGEGDSVLIIAQWHEVTDDLRCIAWARESFLALQPSMREVAYVNYLSDDNSPETLTTAYATNYARLREIKHRYDPNNVFHVNQNIR